MYDQWKASLARKGAIGFACIGFASVMAGCVATGGVKDGSSFTARPSSAAFTVSIDAADPADKQIVVAPDQGDAWLESVASPGREDNKIVWRSSVSFSVKFVQIDDQSKKPSEKFGDEGDGWNDAVRDGSDYKYKVTLDKGSGGKRKTIRGAKYLVKSPAGCDDSNPGPNCLVLDPVIIVRF